MTRLLYVEDNEDNIYMLSNRLLLEGFDVSIASTGAEGVAMARDELPDLVIMDLVLPEHKHRAIDAGCDDFETKPVDFPCLLGKIRQLLQAEES